MLEKVSSNAVYNLGLDFISFYHIFFKLLISLLHFSGFCHCCLLNVFLFLTFFFFAVSISILLIILMFSSLVIQKLLKISFLFVSLLVNCGRWIKSAKDTIITVIKTFIYTRVHVKILAFPDLISSSSTTFLIFGEISSIGISFACTLFLPAAVSLELPVDVTAFFFIPVSV